MDWMRKNRDDIDYILSTKFDEFNYSDIDYMIMELGINVISKEYGYGWNKNDMNDADIDVENAKKYIFKNDDWYNMEDLKNINTKKRGLR